MRTFRQVYSAQLMSKDIAVITKDFFDQFSFWADLDKEEQKVVRSETVSLSNILGRAASLRIEMGERLARIQAVLEPRRQFKKYLKTLNFSWRTGYRYIAVYKAVKAGLPEAAIRLSAAKGIDLAGYNAKTPFGPYQGAVTRNPAPSDEALIPQWLETIQEDLRRHPPRRSKKVKTPEECMKEAYRECAAGYNCIPPGRMRTYWAQRLIGILMGEFGLPAQAFKPEAVPEGFRPEVGRPKGKKK